MPEFKISLRQLTVLTALFTIGSAILIVPSGMAAAARQDAWIAALVGCALGFIVLALQQKLAQSYSGMNLMQITEKLLGKWIGKTVYLLFLLSLFFTGAATVLQDIGTFMTTQMMPETPIQAIILLFVSIIVIGVRLGIEVMARSAELLFPWFLLLFFSMTLLLLSKVDWKKMQPVLESGISPLLPAALTFISTVFLPSIVLLAIYPSSVNRPADAHKAVYIGSLIGAAVMFIVITLTILVLGPHVTSIGVYPSYTLVKKINIGNFLQRIEVFMAIMWFISLYFRISLYFYAIVTGLSQLFRIKNYQPLVLPFGWILAAVSVFIYPNTPYQLMWDSKTWIPYILTFGVIMPLVLLGVHLIRTMAAKKKNADTPAQSE